MKKIIFSRNPGIHRAVCSSSHIQLHLQVQFFAQDRRRPEKVHRHRLVPFSRSHKDNNERTRVPDRHTARRAHCCRAASPVLWWRSHCGSECVVRPWRYRSCGPPFTLLAVRFRPPPSCGDFLRRRPPPLGGGDPVGTWSSPAPLGPAEDRESFFGFLVWGEKYFDPYYLGSLGTPPPPPGGGSTPDHPWVGYGQTPPPGS